MSAHVISAITVRVPLHIVKRLKGLYRLQGTSLTAISTKILVPELSRLYEESVNEEIKETLREDRNELNDNDTDFYRLTMEM